MVLRKFSFVALLLYVALDLSVPSIPGAFVFELNQSVESIRSGHAPALSAPSAPLRSPNDPHGMTATSVRYQIATRDVALNPPVIRSDSRALRDPGPPSSEDPH